MYNKTSISIGNDYFRFRDRYKLLNVSMDCDIWQTHFLANGAYIVMCSLGRNYLTQLDLVFSTFLEQRQLSIIV